ncbi:MAG: redox-sensing transcriptional repressor Rex [Coriobacteriia bacterium]
MDRLSQVPHTTIQRLPLYLRCLLQAQAMMMPVISSVGIADMCGTNAAQVRKDFSYLGELGTRGIGYDVEALITHFSRILGITERRRAAIIGYGKFGAALEGYSGFAERGFKFVAILDIDPDKIGTEVGDLVVESMDEAVSVLRDRDVEIVIISTPASAAQAAADVAAEAGVKAILNLAPVLLTTPSDVMVRQVCLSTDLQILSFHLAQDSSGEA